MQQVQSKNWDALSCEHSQGPFPHVKDPNNCLIHFRANNKMRFRSLSTIDSPHKSDADSEDMGSFSTDSSHQCAAFAREGYCRFGSECDWDHGAPEGPLRKSCVILLKEYPELLFGSPRRSLSFLN